MVTHTVTRSIIPTLAPMLARKRTKFLAQGALSRFLKRAVLASVSALLLKYLPFLPRAAEFDCRPGLMLGLTAVRPLLQLVHRPL
jgi:hypothetical protein